MGTPIVNPAEALQFTDSLAKYGPLAVGVLLLLVVLPTAVTFRAHLPRLIGDWAIVAVLASGLTFLGWGCVLWTQEQSWQRQARDMLIAQKLVVRGVPCGMRIDPLDDTFQDARSLDTDAQQWTYPLVIISTGGFAPAAKYDIRYGIDRSVLTAPDGSGQCQPDSTLKTTLADGGARRIEKRLTVMWKTGLERHFEIKNGSSLDNVSLEETEH